MTAESMRIAGRRAFLAGAMATAGIACAPPCRADTGPSLVGLEVVDRGSGTELPVWRHRGRAYVAGAPGSRYGLRVSNRTGERVLVVLSVDGVNVLSGETARFGQGGYVLGPYQSCDVNGWRKSDAQVAAFVFSGLAQSYAARTGRPGDVGVIGMAVFTERPSPPPYASPADRSRSGAALDAPPPPLPMPPVKAPLLEAQRAPSASAAARAPGDGDALQPREEKLGTAHGEREWSYSERTTFRRATSYPQSTRQIEYDTYANLAARGVVPGGGWTGHRPRPFPLEPDAAGFVPDPPETR